LGSALASRREQKTTGRYAKHTHGMDLGQLEIETQCYCVQTTDALT